jgi:hypothetical protein
MKMAKPWPMLASALNDLLGWGAQAWFGKFTPTEFDPGTHKNSTIDYQ